MEISDRKIIVLLYHRINELDTDPWGICVSPKHFEEQVTFIKEHVPVITAEEVASQVAANRIEENGVCITFDDGYADNAINALPILSERHCPATFFIATAFTGHAQPYWWDELEMICLHARRLPPLLRLLTDTQAHDFHFETTLTKRMWQLHKDWKWYAEPPTKRCDAFLKLWNLLRPLPYAVICEKMAEMRAWANTDFHSRLPMSRQQLRLLGSSEWTTLGLHTHTHMDLSSQSDRCQEADILKGKAALANLSGSKTDLLAYPYGRYNANTLSVVEKLGMEGCFTTEGVPVMANSHLAKLGRYQVFNVNGQEFGRQLMDWWSC